MSEMIPQTAQGGRSGWRTSIRLEIVLLAGLLTLGVLVPLVVGLAAGSQDIARNDDWVYRRISLDLAGSGVLALHSVTSMLIGQILLVQPFLKVFGLQSSAFTAFGAVAAFGAVLASYALARQFVGPFRAALATALVLVFPGYLAYATSFMTDVPTLALELACVAFGVAALREHPVRLRWLLVSAVFGWLAFSIREFAIAAPVGVLLAAICAEPRRLRTWAVVIGLTAACGLLVVLKSTLPGQHLSQPVGAVSTGVDLSQLAEAMASVSLVLLPATIAAFVRWRSTWKRADTLVGAELGIVLVAYQLFEWYQNGSLPLVLLTNLTNQHGVPGPILLVGTRPLLFGDPAWLAISAFALLASVLALVVGAGITGSLVRRHRGSIRAAARALGSPMGVLVLFTSLLGLGLVGYGVHWAVYDRYYWPLIPPAATLLMYLSTGQASNRGSLSPRVKSGVGAALVGITLVAGIFMLNSFAFDSARWRAGEALVQLGVAPDELDAGYEWVGTHAPTLPNSVEPGSGLTFYENYFAGYRACGVVAADPWVQSGYVLVGTQSYDLTLIAGPTASLYLYRSTSPDCRS